MRDQISITEMAEYLQAGTAQALLPDGAPGPVRLHGQWWAVLAGGEHYRPVTDADTVAMLDDNGRRYARAHAARQNMS